MAQARSNSATPPRLQRLIREAKALVALAMAFFLAAILLTHTLADPGFSTTGANLKAENLGGAFGAWLSDILLYVFGYSAWWWVAFAAGYAWRMFRHLDESPLAGGRAHWLAGAGYGVLLLASSGLEGLRLWSWSSGLPYFAGGLIGHGLGSAALALFGFVGSTLGLILAAAIGFSLFTGTSWLQITEWVGQAMENAWWTMVGFVQRKRDERIGQQAAQRREEIVVQEKRRMEEAHEATPLRIEPVVMEIPKSERRLQEKQTPLFQNCRTRPCRPCICWMRRNSRLSRVSTESLEFTSLMIERKLKEFGVEVKVVSASPGPVITRYEIEPAVGVKGSQIVNLCQGPGPHAVGDQYPGGGGHSRQDLMGLEIPNPKRQMVRLSEILGSKVYNDTRQPTDRGDGQGHFRPSGGRRPGQDAACAGGRHHRFRQIGGASTP